MAEKLGLAIRKLRMRPLGSFQAYQRKTVSRLVFLLVFDFYPENEPMNMVGLDELLIE